MQTELFQKLGIDFPIFASTHCRVQCQDAKEGGHGSDLGTSGKVHG